jgi:hypothetical protein
MNIDASKKKGEGLWEMLGYSEELTRFREEKESSINIIQALSFSVMAESFWERREGVSM